MVPKVGLVVVLVVLSAVAEVTTQLPKVVTFCFEYDCYIRPDNTQKTWTDAQETCKKYNSTLPIVDSPDRQRSVVAALRNFTLSSNAGDVWLGGNASVYSSKEWRWLDGSQYNGTVQGGGTYAKSYAVFSISGFIASAPTDTYTYVCQYKTTADDCMNGTGRLAFIKEPLCYMKYDIKVSWFNARNNCLSNGSDLASVTDLSFYGILLDDSGSWVGLRHSQWFWQNAVTGLSSDVRYTSWDVSQPDDQAPSCIAIDTSVFPNWKDWNCSNQIYYICQVVGLTATLVSTQEATSTTRPKSYSTLSPTSEARSLRPPSSTATTNSDNSYSTESNQSLSKEDNKNNSNVAIGVGIGVGLPCAVIVIALIVTVIILQRKNRCRKPRNRLKNKSADPNNVQESRGKESNSPSFTSQAIENDGEENMQYEQLRIQSQLQDQRVYEQLGTEQSPYERV